MFKRIISLAAALALAVFAALGTAGTANAATTTFQLCNFGSDYRVSAAFFGTPRTTSVIPPGACATATINAGTSFTLWYSHQINSGSVIGTTLTPTFSSGRTMVWTSGSFNNFKYVKFRY